jgi:hypothetical protein
MRFLILALLIVAALAAYGYGSSTGLVIFIILGIVFEGLFWFGLLGKKKEKTD